MTTFERQDLANARFTRVNLRGARFRAVDLSGAVMRAVDVDGAEIDAPWLLAGEAQLLVNGVDVVPYVEAELNRRFPGRAAQRASDPPALRAAFDALEQAWAAEIERAAAMRSGTVDVSVDGEWSFAQTLRHLILATDMWFGKAVQQRDNPFHPIGLIDDGSADELPEGTLTAEPPSFAEVLQVRADRVTQVRDYLAHVTGDDLVAERPNPHDPQYPETVLGCLRTILEEGWEHLRYARRDLDAIEARSPEP